MEVSDILARGVRDPGVGFVTLTRVRVTEDLLQARIYYTTLGGADQRQRTARALERAQPFIRRSLASRLRLRRVPEIAFAFDQSIAHQARVEELIEQIHREDAERAEHEEHDEHKGHEGHEEHEEHEEEHEKHEEREGHEQDEGHEEDEGHERTRPGKGSGDE